MTDIERVATRISHDRARAALGRGAPRDGGARHRCVGDAERQRLARRLCQMVHRRAGPQRLSAHRHLPSRRSDDPGRDGRHRPARQARRPGRQQSRHRRDHLQPFVLLHRLYARLRPALVAASSSIAATRPSGWSAAARCPPAWSMPSATASPPRWSMPATSSTHQGRSRAPRRSRCCARPPPCRTPSSPRWWPPSSRACATAISAPSRSTKGSCSAASRASSAARPSRSAARRSCAAAISRTGCCRRATTSRS